jgi:hypothetical protein
MSTVGPRNEPAFSGTANIVISDPPTEFAVSNGCDTKTLSRSTGPARVTSVTGFRWTP